MNNPKKVWQELKRIIKMQCEAPRYNLKSTSSNQKKLSPPEDKTLQELKYVLPLFGNAKGQ